MRYWYCKDDNADDAFLYEGSVAPVKDADGDWVTSEMEDGPYEWWDEDEISEKFGNIGLGVFPGISKGKIMELSIKLVVERCE